MHQLRCCVCYEEDLLDMSTTRTRKCYRLEEVAISEFTVSPQLGGFVGYPTGVAVRLLYRRTQLGHDLVVRCFVEGFT